jgi:hypothetical protein
MGQDIFQPGPVTLLGRPTDPNGFLITATRNFGGTPLALLNGEVFKGYQDAPLYPFFGHNIIENDCDVEYTNYTYSPPVVEEGHCRSTVVWFVPAVRGAIPNTPPPKILRWEKYMETYAKNADGSWDWSKSTWDYLSEWFELDGGGDGVCNYQGSIPSNDQGYFSANNGCQEAL